MPKLNRKTKARARATAGLVLSRDRADALLALLFTAAKGLETVWPSTAQKVREAYTNLAEAYAAAGYDVADL